MIHNKCIGYDITDSEDLMNTIGTVIKEEKSRIKNWVNSKQVMKNKCLGEIRFFETPEGIDESDAKATVKVIYSQDGRGKRKIRLDYFANENPKETKSMQMPDYGEYVDGHLQLYDYNDKLYDFYMNDGFDDIFDELENIARNKVLEHSCPLLDAYDISDLSRGDITLELNKYGDLEVEIDTPTESFRHIEPLKNIIDAMDKNALDYLSKLVKDKQKELLKQKKEVEK